MNKKQILYLSYDGMTDPLGQSQVLPYLIGLSKNEYEFTLISFEKKERYNQNKTTIEQICRENNIDWQPLFYTKKPPIFSTIWDIFKLNKKVKQLHRKKQFQLIHCRSYITSLIGLAFKKKYGVNFIFDMRGFWADERVDGGLWNLKNPLYRWVYHFFKQKEKEFLIYADKVISLTENGKQEMLTWNIPNLTPEKITVIPCAADYNLFELVTDEKRKLSKQNLGLNNNEFVLSYIGSIGTWYLLDEMLHFFSILKTQQPNAKFLFLTPDSKDDILKTAKKYSLIEDDFIIQFTQRKDIPKIAHASDYSIFFIKPAYSKKSSSPTKMGELLAMGIPLICNNIGDVKQIVKDTNGGMCIEDFNKETLLMVIENIRLINNSESNKMRTNSEKYNSLTTGINSYISTYKRMLK